MDLTLILLTVAGFVLLLAGAELLVRGASALALRLGLSPLIVGLTVVAFGTSAPELAVSVGAGLNGQGDIALGNVIGSNILNVLLILGLSAVVTPLLVDSRLVRRDVPLLIGASVVLLVMALDGRIGRLDGVVLFAGIVAYTTSAVIAGRREGAAASASASGKASEGETHGKTSSPDAVIDSPTAEGSAAVSHPMLAVGMTLGGLAMLVLGANWLVAAVTGSLTSFDLPVMIATAVACLPIFATGHLIARGEGALFLAYYLAYVTYLILGADPAGGGQALLGVIDPIMLWFVLPLTAVTLALLWYREHRGRHASV